MTETAKERIYREALENTRDKLDGFEEQYANKEVYSAFDELTGIVEKGLSQASKIPVSTDKLSVEKFQKQLYNVKKVLTEIIEIPYSDNYFDEEERLSCMKEVAEKALSDWRGK